MTAHVHVHRPVGRPAAQLGHPAALPALLLLNQKELGTQQPKALALRPKSGVEHAGAIHLVRTQLGLVAF